MINLPHMYLDRCIDLAVRGRNRVNPNPMVGSVLVYRDKIIGEGWHEAFGQPHAEVNCLNSISDEHKVFIPQSTLYVSLEPCNHHGKTPPCTDLILRHRIPKVVVGTTDPHPLVQGSGLDRLRREGVEVHIVHHERAQLLLRPFVANSLYHRPFIILKWAQSRDGYMGSNDKRVRISGPLADMWVHQWRSESDAIMVGTNTVITDDPMLTTRHLSGRNPVRIIPDLKERIPEDVKIKTTEVPTLIFTRHRQEKADSLEYISIGEGQVLDRIFKEAMERRLYTILVEGGSQILSSLIQKNLWDEARIITAPHELGNGVKAPTMTGRKIGEYNAGHDRISVLIPNRSESR